MSRSVVRSVGLGIGLLVVVLGVRAKVGGPLSIEAPTLAPSLPANAMVWVWKWSSEVSPGDAAWVQWPGTTLTGAYRVVAVGPATVEVRSDTTVWVDGKVLPRTEQDDGWQEVVGGYPVPIIPGGPSLPHTQLAQGEVFMLSDARPLGGDSRVHGAIPHSAILGTIAGFPAGDRIR